MSDKKKILILGASGFLGTKIVEYSRNIFEVYSSYFSHKPKFFSQRIFNLNLLDFKGVTDRIKKIRPKIIIYALRVEGVNFDRFIDSIKNLVSLVEKQKIRFIFFSSDAVFDGQKGNYKEFDQPSPVTEYGEKKYEAEKIIQSYLSDFIIIRPSHIYGKYQDGFDKRINTILQDLSRDKIIRRYKNMYRSPILVDDLAKAALKFSLSDYQGIIHLAGKERISLFEFSQKVATCFKFNENLIEPADIVSDSKRIAPDASLDITKARETIEFNPLTLMKGLKVIRDKD